MSPAEKPFAINELPKQFGAITRVVWLCAAGLAGFSSAHAAPDCASFDVAGVRLGMSSEQARAAITRHFNLKPEDRDQWEGWFRDGNNEFCYPDDFEGASFAKNAEKKAYSEAEVNRLGKETPDTALAYRCGEGSCFVDENTPQPPNLQVLFVMRKPINFALPEAAWLINYVRGGRELTKGEVLAKFAAFGSPKTNADSFVTWDTSCAFRGEVVNLYIEYTAGADGEGSLVVTAAPPKKNTFATSETPDALSHIEGAIAWKKAKAKGSVDITELEAYAKELKKQFKTR